MSVSWELATCINNCKMQGVSPCASTRSTNMVILKCPIQYKAFDTQYEKMWATCHVPKQHEECNKWFIKQKAISY